MADVLKVYKDNEVVASAERGEDGKATATIDGLNPDTDYTAGDYQAAWENENGESDKTDVPSFKTKPIAVTGVELDKDEITLEVGETAQLNVTIKPSTATNKNFKFMSSNRQIASPDDNGLVTAVSKGSADAVVQTEDGQHEASCKVNVVEPEEPDESDSEE